MSGPSFYLHTGDERRRLIGESFRDCFEVLPLLRAHGVNDTRFSVRALDSYHLPSLEAGLQHRLDRGLRLIRIPDMHRYPTLKPRPFFFGCFGGHPELLLLLVETGLQRVELRGRHRVEDLAVE